jgi:hypothetical protein
MHNFVFVPEPSGHHPRFETYTNPFPCHIQPQLEKKLQSADWRLPVNMKYTAANTPQQNALVEVKFTYLASKARAAMHAAEVPRDRRLEFYS